MLVLSVGVTYMTYGMTQAKAKRKKYKLLLRYRCFQKSFFVPNLGLSSWLAAYYNGIGCTFKE